MPWTLKLAARTFWPKPHSAGLRPSSSAWEERFARPVSALHGAGIALQGQVTALFAALHLPGDSSSLTPQGLFGWGHWWALGTPNFSCCCCSGQDTLAGSSSHPQPQMPQPQHGLGFAAVLLPHPAHAQPAPMRPDKSLTSHLIPPNWSAHTSEGGLCAGYIYVAISQQD